MFCTVVKKGEDASSPPVEVGQPSAIASRCVRKRTSLLSREPKRIKTEPLVKAEMNTRNTAEVTWASLSASDADEAEHKVERILAHKTAGERKLWHVLWRDGETTWEPRASFVFEGQVNAVWRAYETAHASAPTERKVASDVGRGSVTAESNAVCSEPSEESGSEASSSSADSSESGSNASSSLSEV